VGDLDGNFAQMEMVRLDSLPGPLGLLEIRLSVRRRRLSSVMVRWVGKAIPYPLSLKAVPYPLSLIPPLSLSAGRRSALAPAATAPRLGRGAAGRRLRRELHPESPGFGKDAEATQSLRDAAREGAPVSQYRWAMKREETSATLAYLYYFERAIPWPDHPEFGAFHTGEGPYVFNNLG
jgi:hypothetical protein